MEDLLGYIRRQPDRAANLRHILDDFQADKTDRKQIKDMLDQLVGDGKLVRHRGNRYEAAPELRMFKGRISLHSDGYGFVTPEETVPGIDGDIFIPPPATGSALDRDIVEFVIVSRKSSEGRVVRVTERARTTIVGQLRFDGRTYFVSPADRKLPDRILVGGDVSEHKDKIVEVELTKFGSESTWPAGTIVGVLGFIDDPDVETIVIMRKYGLETAFPEEVESEAGRQPVELTEADLEGRTDFRDRDIITIDPATARDFDDAVDVEPLSGGGFRVGIHIADVAHFVAMGSATDKEARNRGCSVYFPDRVVPMLPEKLSNTICSLNPRTDRLAMSVVLEVDGEGRVQKESFHNSVIRSRERMNYEQVQEILDGEGSVRKRYHAIVGIIEELATAARLLQSRRRARGTIDFDLPEPELSYDESGKVAGVVKAERHFSHKLIEEFMIAANESVARMLENEMPQTLYRIHEPPDPQRVGELSETLGALGLRFDPKKITPLAFQRFLDSVVGRPDEQMISFVVLRSFRQAVYSTKNLGHFGLASGCYTHFTSPIRRYPDLVIHRLLKALLAGTRRSGYIPAELETIAQKSSAQERIADMAERDLFEWKRMVLLEEHIGDTLDAIITSVLGRGLRVELVDYFIEGYIGVDELTDDYYDFEPRSRTLIGRGTRRKYRLGQKIQVMVARIDKLIGRAYFMPVLAKKGRTV